MGNNKEAMQHTMQGNMGHLMNAKRYGWDNTTLIYRI